MNTVALELDDYLARRGASPESRERIEAHAAEMLSEVRAYHLRELREQLDLTQDELAKRIGVGQRQVSKIERGDIDSARIGTVRRYLEAVGAGFSVEAIFGDSRVQVA